MYQCDRRFWLENPTNVLCDYTLLPTDNMSVGSKLNAITRLVMFLTMYLHLVGSKYVWIFAGLSLLSIVCLYYYQRDTMKTVERFQIPTAQMYDRPSKAYSPGATSSDVKAIMLDSVDPQSTLVIGKNPMVKRKELIETFNSINSNTKTKPFNDACTWESMPVGTAGYQSRFENMYKGNDPRTLVPPNITPRLWDRDAWDRGDLYEPSYLNTKRAFDMVNSGYLPEDDPSVGYLTAKTVIPQDTDYKWPLVHDFSDENHMYNYKMLGDMTRPQMVEKRILTLDNTIDKTKDIQMTIENKAETIEPFNSKKAGCNTCKQPPPPIPIVENFQPNTYQTSSMNSKRTPSGMSSYDTSYPATVGSVYSGDLLARCGYDRDNLLYNIPVNTSVGACDQRPEMASYNEALYSIAVQPDVYYRSQIQEPIGSNIGISFNQTLPITTQQMNADGSTTLTNMDPRTFKVAQDPVSRDDDVLDITDIYDTRDTGYGPAYRGYVHELTGQPRWYYKDIDDVQRNSYISFNDIDILEKADKRGIIATPEDVRQRAAGFIQYVDHEFIERTNNMRIQMQQTFADKARDPTVQLRRNPIVRGGWGKK